MSGRLIYAFGAGRAQGSAALRGLLGGKGAGLAEMSRLGLPVPPGFTITTAACRLYLRRPRSRPLEAVPGLRAQFDRALARLEKTAGRRLGDPGRPLLLSVRSGAAFSMPGMMDTILDLGLGADCVEGLARESGSRRFALDSRRRLVSMFGQVVRGIPHEAFEEILSREGGGGEPDEAALERVNAAFLELYGARGAAVFPEDARVQLEEAVSAVFGSWNNPRAASYRKANAIPEDLGTACTVQAMVFGNRGRGSLTGVGFTRDPATGARELYGECLHEAQGEDVVAGIRTPRPLAELRRSAPQLYRELKAAARRLERRYRDVQDFEFTVESGTLYLLQTRAGKRSAAAALRVAVDMVAEGLIRADEAVLRVEPSALDQLLRPVFDDKARRSARPLAKGLPAGPGAASGRLVFTADDAVRESAKGPVILVRQETNPDDIHGMFAAQGILTATGGLTSHAAVVGRGLGKVCVVGCAAVSLSGGTLSVDGTALKEGDVLSLDGFTGEVFAGALPTQPSEILQVLEGRRPPTPLYRAYRRFMSWVDARRRLGVRANADRPEDARVARLLGAEGIGLCRTEHMFFGEDRIGKMLALIVAEGASERGAALDALFPLQKEDFKVLLRVMDGLPVIVRTLDPPLHEFLPHDPDEARRLAVKYGFDARRLWEAAERLKEVNPMLGHRGCRLGITIPELTRMQARALLSAARELREEGLRPRPELMIPLVGYPAELRHERGVVEEAAREAGGRALACPVGTMIEVPRAVFQAAEIARAADFFSFGTNDLTQMTLGYSRDDYGKFLGAYLEKKILPVDPFQTLDRDGVGAAVRLAVASARSAKRGLELGVCGEHGGDPASIAFFHEAGLDYVSCSPYRVPIARLAAAQAALRAAARGKVERDV